MVVMEAVHGGEVLEEGRQCCCGTKEANKLDTIIEKLWHSVAVASYVPNQTHF